MIAGPSGVGKTTLCNYISQRHNIPFVPSSTKVLWKEEGIKSHEEIIKRCALEPMWGLDFQYKSLGLRQVVMNDYDHFVTDRSPLCNLVYTLTQVSPYVIPEATHGYVKAVHSLMEQFLKEKDAVFIYIPFNKETVLEDNNMRVMSTHYQIALSAIYESVMKPYANSDPHKILVLPMWDLDLRKLIVDTHIIGLNRGELPTTKLEWLKNR